jgi:hypothetical protein
MDVSTVLLEEDLSLTSFNSGIVMILRTDKNGPHNMEY